ncbi:MAG: twin-arginine translocation signal domain-containing protein, partial [Nitrospira sp.]|nr:twin-arginine translocation signal domain-containing protein [Nitrospira sp.]
MGWAHCNPPDSKKQKKRKEELSGAESKTARGWSLHQEGTSYQKEEKCMFLSRRQFLKVSAGTVAAV